MDLNGKCVLLGVSGGIAAYKMANVASALRKLGADVEVIMTKNATQFITPLTFETLTGHKCMVDTFDRDFKFEVTHISLAKKADVILVAPATANVIAKMAHGIADDMLTTVVLAAKCPKLVAPAMNTGMLENPITQDNLATLERYGFTVIPSESGVLACKDVGSGRLPKEEVLLEHILHTIARPKDLAGVRVAVTAGPTQEALDPVRYLTNHSTGKMGYALARAAAKGFINATDCADYLTKKGMPFRDAYKLTGCMVSDCIAADKTLEELTLTQFQSYSPLFEADIYDAIDLVHCCEGRTSYGGPSAASVEKQIALAAARLDAWEEENA